MGRSSLDKRNPGLLQPPRLCGLVSKSGGSMMEDYDEDLAAYMSDDGCEPGDTGICDACNGSGEGEFDGSVCLTCRGRGEA